LFCPHVPRWLGDRGLPSARAGRRARNRARDARSAARVRSRKCIHLPFSTQKGARGTPMILERYIRREIVEKIGWTAGLLILVLASNRFVEYLADAAAGKLPAGLIAQMLAMKLTAMLPRLLPVALFLAVMLALSRMARDRELVAVMG